MKGRKGGRDFLLIIIRGNDQVSQLSDNQNYTIFFSQQNKNHNNQNTIFFFLEKKKKETLIARRLSENDSKRP